MSQCGKDRADSHACANLHKLLHKSGYTLPVRISTCTTPVRLAKRGSSKKAMVQFPILKLSDWARCILRHGGQFLLGGQSLAAQDSFGRTLELFWERYRRIEPSHPFFKSNHDWRRSLPYALHGDEGRGAGKKPIMVLGAQPLVTSPDMSQSNIKGCLG